MGRRPAFKSTAAVSDDRQAWVGGRQLPKTFADPCGHDAGFRNVDLVHHHPGIGASGIARNAIHRCNDSRLGLGWRRREVLKVEAT